MDTIPTRHLDLERAARRVASLRERLQEHRTKPLTTREWKENEESLLEELAATEGELAKRTAERGIVDA